MSGSGSGSDPSDGFLEYSVDRCLFNSTDPNDVEFIRAFYFNKVEDVVFSSKVGEFVGYTEPGLSYAKNWNKDSGYIAGLRAQKEVYCLNHIGVDYQAALTKS
ncbi:PREDICTED: H-2 class II histocompatibility antigen, E-S beta chain-like, partial [Cyprinodon variegatus]|uniref:H-2 class II histocompatibility antigen, E-S beta chain-like n=1 Tax=Cyprinodon variegatus TaxID=28743 RepID=UPI0007428E47